MDLVAAVETDAALRAFVEAGGMAQVLSEIEGEEFRHAGEALKDIERGEDPKPVVRRVLAYLESAHSEARTRWKGQRRLNFDENTAMENVDFWTCCLAAVCHKYLKDASVDVDGMLEEAGQALKGVGALRAFAEMLLAAVCRGFMWLDFRCSKGVEPPQRLTREEFDEFRKRLRGAGPS